MQAKNIDILTIIIFHVILAAVGFNEIPLQLPQLVYPASSRDFPKPALRYELS